MAQFDYGVIDPSTKSGSQLAADLSAQRLSVNSHHLGASEPIYRIAGMMWIDSAAAPIWKLKIYDGAAWINLFDIDITSDAASSYIGGLLASFGGAASRNIGTGSNDVPINSLLGALAYLNTVNTGNIANSAIVTALLADGAVTGPKIGNSAINTARIADRAVTLDKMATGTAGRVIGYDETGAPVEIDLVTAHGYAVFNTVGTFTWTVPPDAKYVKVYVVGGGAGGGGNIGASGTGGQSSFGGYFIGYGGGGAGGGGGNSGNPAGGAGRSGTGNSSFFYTIYNGSNGQSLSTVGSWVSGGTSWFQANKSTILDQITANNVENLAALATIINGRTFGVGGNAHYAGAGGGAGTCVGSIDLAFNNITSVSITVGAGTGTGNYSYDKGGTAGTAGIVLISW